MYSRCVSEKSAAQQRQFEAALLKMMKDRLFEEISVSELCRNTGLSRKIFYRLYESKADVVYALIDHVLLDAGSFEPDETVGAGRLHRFLAYWKSQKELLDVMKKNRISALLSQQAVIHIMQEAPEIARCFGADDSPYGRELIVFYITGLFSLVLDWAYRDFDYSIDEMSAMIMDLLFNPPVKMPLPVSAESEN
jgi:AcrR family transcriptional regulator